jgi:hypothetical protein
MRTVTITEIELNHAISALYVKINENKSMIHDSRTFESKKRDLQIELKALYQVLESLEDKRHALRK